MRRLTISHPAIAAVAILAAATGAAATDPSLPGSPFRPHELGGEVYSEVYTTVLQLGDGTWVEMQQAVTNIGPGDGHAMCRVLIVGDRPAFHRAPTYRRGDWTFESPGRLRVGPCAMEHRPDRVLLHAEVEGATLDATLDRGLLVTSPPGHHVPVGRRFFAQQVLLPWARLSGSLREAGRDRALVGYGAVYRYWVTAFPDDFAELWVRAWAMGPGGGFWVLAHRPPACRAPVGCVWVPGATEPMPVDDLDVEAVDHGAVCVVRSGSRCFRLALGEPAFRHAPVEEVGFFGFLVRPFLGNPVTRTYRARLTGTGRALPAAALVEISTDG